MIKLKMNIPGCNDIAGMAIINGWRRVGKVQTGCLRLLTQCHSKLSEKLGEATSHTYFENAALQSTFKNEFAEGKPNRRW
jgi:hypothetical protein